MLPASMLGDYCTSASSTPSHFPCRYSTYFFFSSSFLDHHTDRPTRHDARILLMSASLMPSEFFHRHFDLLEARFL
jgi:hypothetical protein